MANKKITELDNLTTPSGADIIAIVDDVSGIATTKKVTVTNLLGQAPVQSVNTATGAVVLDADDIDDASTTNKFVTASDITNLGNLSGTNTGDQAAGALTDFDFDDNAIFGFAAKVETPTITANAYTLVAADNGKVLALDNGATAMTLNVDTGLPASFNCSFIQTGSGQVSFAGTATVNNRQSHTKINGQYGVASIVAYATDTYILAGDTAS